MKKNLRRQIFFPILFIVLLSVPLELITVYGMRIYDRMQRAERFAAQWEGQPAEAVRRQEERLRTWDEPLISLEAGAGVEETSLKDAFLFHDAEGRLYLVRAVPPDLWKDASFLLIPAGVLVICGFVAAEFTTRRVVKKNVTPLRHIAEYLNRMLRGDFDPAIEPPSYDGEAFHELLGDAEQRAAFKSMLLQLRENERLRRQFSANVTHELKSPLTSINGYAEMIAGGLTSPEDAQAFAGIIHREGMRLLRMIDEIIQLSEFDTGHVHVETKEPVALEELLHEEVELLQPMAEERNIEIVVEGQAAPVLGNRRLLGDVLRNLLSNAIKYSKPGGGRVEIRLRESEGWVECAVSDYGIGIAPEEQKRIFERFYVVDKARTRQNGTGTGLGLSLVKHTMQAHGGQVIVHSQLGIGSTFVLRFPKERKESA